MTLLIPYPQRQSILPYQFPMLHTQVMIPFPQIRQIFYQSYIPSFPYFYRLLQNRVFRVIARRGVTKQSYVIIEVMRFLRFARNDVIVYFAEVYAFNINENLR